MSELSKEEGLRLAERLEHYAHVQHVPEFKVTSISEAIRSLVARLEAAEKKAAGLMTVTSNDANDIVQLGLAMEEVQHKLARAEAALAERDEAIGAALAVLPAFRPPGTDLHRLVNLARGMLDVGDGPTRVAEREPLQDGRDHLTVTGKFQSDKYPWCAAGFVPLKVADPMAADLLAEYARRRGAVDAEFERDLVEALADQEQSDE